MRNSVDKATRMEHAIQLSKEIEDEEEQLQIQGMINLLADKFIKNLSQLSKVKELLSMTLIGEMIREDAIIAEKEETAREALREGIDIDVIVKITKLNKAVIQKLQKELQVEAS